MNPTPRIPAGNSIIRADGRGGGNASKVVLDDSLLTQPRAIRAPNKAGTIALLDDVISGSSVSVQDEGVAQGTAATLNFVGAGVTASVATGTATITVTSNISDGDKGDVTVSGSGATWTIDPGAVTLAKQANLAANSIVGNNTGSPATPLALTAAQTKTLLAIVPGDITGLAASATTDATNAANIASGTLPAGRMPALTGDVTTTAGTVATSISTNAVGNVKLAQMAANTIKGNNSGATANANDLTADQVATMLPLATTTSKGLLTALPSSGGTGVYLRGDGTWQAVAGAGTVTSVAVSGGTTGLSTTGGPITGAGTITLTGTLAIANGGTGATTAAGATAALNAMVGDSGSGGTKGMVPAPAAGDAAKYLRGDATWQTVSAEGINYITNGKAESTTTGWATYADAAASLPVDGTGGAPVVTWTRSIPTPLRGVASFYLAKDAVNRQGQGASFDFVIDAADVNKSLTIAADFKIDSGTYAANDVTLHVYDVTNARLCPISSSNGLVATGAVSLQFSTSSSTSYRLIIHVASTSAVAYNLQFDNISVGPAFAWAGPAMSDWVDGGAITITATTTNPTKGTTAVDKVRWRRVGDSAEIEYEFDMTAAGTNGSGDYLLAMPAGLTMASSVTLSTAAEVEATKLMRGSGGVSNGINRGYAYLVPYNSTQFRVMAASAFSSHTFVSSAFYGLGAAATKFRVSVLVPIAGWSGTTAVQPGSRYLWSQRFAATATRVTTTPSKPGEYRARRSGVDTAPTTGPTAGDGFRIDSGSGIAAGRINQYDIYIGPGKVVQIAASNTTGRTGGISTDFANATVLSGLLTTYDAVTGVATVFAGVTNAGDLCGRSADGSTTYATGYIDILVADDPVPVAIAPDVYVDATTTSGQVLTASVTDIIWGTKTVDTHGAMNASTGVFTAPVAGQYLITESHRFGATSGAVPAIYRGGTFQMSGSFGGSATNTGCVCACLQLAAGDTITVRDTGSAGVALSTTTNHCRIQIVRIGN